MRVRAPRQRPVHPNAGAVRRLALAVVATATLAGCSSGGAVEVDAPVPSAQDRAACERLLEALPSSVADQESRPVEAGDGAAAAWGDPAIVLTCGGGRPAGFSRVSSCTTVNDIDWFIPEEQLDAEEPVDLTMTTIHREQYVEVTLPAEYGPPATTLADLSDAVGAAIEPTGSCV